MLRFWVLLTKPYHSTIMFAEAAKVSKVTSMCARLVSKRAHLSITCLMKIWFSMRIVHHYAFRPWWLHWRSLDKPVCIIHIFAHLLFVTLFSFLRKLRGSEHPISCVVLGMLSKNGAQNVLCGCGLSKPWHCGLLYRIPPCSRHYDIRSTLEFSSVG